MKAFDAVGAVRAIRDRQYETTRGMDSSRALRLLSEEGRKALRQFQRQGRARATGKAG